LAVTVAPDEVHRLIERVLEGTYALESRLEAAGEPRAHEWLFHVREILLDLRHALALAAALPDAGTAEEARRALRALAAELGYGMAPHAEHHMSALIEALETDGEG
jgi:hypothetical protein